jgi:hypothetical protein
METTKNIHQLLFRTIDNLAPESFADTAAVRQLLLDTAQTRIPYLYESVCTQIEMLVSEYCGR